MKILICNIPIRQEKGTYPPHACTILCNVLLKAGYDARFYDIDTFRPSLHELAKFFAAEQFDIVGISSVVSTGYWYTKELAGRIRRASPKSLIVLGGNMAAAYNIILRKCKVDICVMGEGEKVILDIARYWEKIGRFDPNDNEIKQIKGIVFLRPDGYCAYTGRQEMVNSTELEQPDYDLLARFSNINQYIVDPLTRTDFAFDARSYAPHRRGKKMATLIPSKGCVNRCTFCHRWIEKYRIIPVQKVVASMKYLMENYNVGFFCIGDECFGENKKWLDEFIERIEPLDILFQIAAARVSIVKRDPSIIKRLKDVGLTAIYFGMESGSNKILKVMEKNASREENLAAAEMCAAAGVFTIFQLVLGMPGENNQTIRETIDFIKKATEKFPFSPQISINYLQALPGTPCYDLLLHQGIVGRTIDEEEKYLLKVFNKDAADFDQYINVSEETLSQVRLWRPMIRLSAEIHWLKHHGWKKNQVKVPAADCVHPGQTSKTSMMFRIRSAIEKSVFTYRAISLMGDLFLKLTLIAIRCNLYGVRKGLLISLGVKREPSPPIKIPVESLRRILQRKNNQGGELHLQMASPTGTKIIK